LKRVVKGVNYATFSEYCVKSRDRNACCYKIRIYIALVLYTLLYCVFNNFMFKTKDAIHDK